MRPRALAALAIGAAALGLAGCASASAADSGAGEPTAGAPESPAAVVEMTQAIAFAPDTVQIRRGQTVEWVNVSTGIGHTVTALPRRAAERAHARLPEGAEPFDSGNIPPGGTWRRRFDVAGTYVYYCTPHELAGMVGVVVVEAP